MLLLLLLAYLIESFVLLYGCVALWLYEERVYIHGLKAQYCGLLMDISPRVRKQKGIEDGDFAFVSNAGLTNIYEKQRELRLALISLRPKGITLRNNNSSFEL